MRYIGRQPDERVTSQIARDVCEREGFKAMLSGSITSLGSRYVIALSAVNCSTGDALGLEQVEAEDKEHVLRALGKASSNLREKLGESLASIQKMSMPIEEATTSSLEAFKAFALGEAQKDRGQDLAAVPFYEHAIELDPNFALAYGRLGVLFLNLGELQRGRENFRKAFALLNRVSERERLYITSHYYAECTRDTDKAIQTLDFYKRTYPKDTSAVNNLALQYERMGQYEKALEGFQEVMRLDPKLANGYINLAWAYFHLNRFEEARAICDRAMAQGLDPAEIYDACYTTAVIQNDQAAVARIVESARGKAGELFILRGQALVALWSGQWHKAEEYGLRAVEMTRQHKLTGQTGFILAALAMAGAEIGNCRQVPERTREALALNRDTALTAAGALAFCGDAAQPEILAAELEKNFPSDTINTNVDVPVIRAIIALKKNQSATALELLRNAAPFERANGDVVYVRGLAHLQAKAGPEAVAAFQNILDHRGAFPFLYSLAHLGLARAAALSGDPARSRKAYQDFLALWKDADPDLPMLQEAKKEYARLQ
ncbi:MAG: hypothetical protein DMG57_05025 [Acidobacteria bacterium]|nr:MAG: hypothetical protein DMG57_05025 [Acidobacteriota bacterium]